MIDSTQLAAARGNVLDSSGDKIGKFGQVYSDDVTGQPEWVTVTTGLFGTNQSFVPLDGATVTGDDLVVAYQKDQVKNAPNVAADGHLSEEEEAELYQYYGKNYDAGYATDGGDGQGAVGHDLSGPETDDAMTRSEERLDVGTERRETGRARLRKYVVTENVTTTVPVSHEEVRVVREPITEANRDAALSGPDLSEEEHEVVLTEERPVVTKETVPVERVRLEKETVAGEEQVSETLREEKIETDVDDTTTPLR